MMILKVRLERRNSKARTKALGVRGDHPCACPKLHTDTGFVAVREGRTDSLEHLVMRVCPCQADRTSDHPHPEEEVHRLVDRAIPPMRMVGANASNTTAANPATSRSAVVSRWSWLGAR